jgi:hypothetical protein
MTLGELLDRIGALRWENDHATPIYATSPENRWQRTEVTDVFRDSDGHIVLEVPEVIRP